MTYVLWLPPWLWRSALRNWLPAFTTKKSTEVGNSIVLSSIATSECCVWFGKLSTVYREYLNAIEYWTSSTIDSLDWQSLLFLLLNTGSPQDCLQNQLLGPCVFAFLQFFFMLPLLLVSQDYHSPLTSLVAIRWLPCSFIKHIFN